MAPAGFRINVIVRLEFHAISRKSKMSFLNDVCLFVAGELEEEVGSAGDLCSRNKSMQPRWEGRSINEASLACSRRINYHRPFTF